MILLAPPDYLPTTVLRGIELGHPLLQSRFATLRAVLQTRGFPLFVNETYRYEVRQQWLFGAGRSIADLLAYGIDPHFARPTDPVVTNAWSAATSAHGFTLRDGAGQTVPASCAIDVVPVGADGRPWTPDDPWEEFTTQCEADANAVGLRHFRNCHGVISDKPHLQLNEWNDHEHRLILPDTPPLVAD